MLDQDLHMYLKWQNIQIETKTKNAENKSQALKRIIKNSSGDIRSGQMLSIIGRSGSGKTTLFNTLCGRLSESLKMTGG